MAFVQIAVIDGLCSKAAALYQFKCPLLGVALLEGNETQPADYWQEHGQVFSPYNENIDQERTKKCIKFMHTKWEYGSLPANH